MGREPLHFALLGPTNDGATFSFFFFFFSANNDVATFVIDHLIKNMIN